MIGDGAYDVFVVDATALGDAPEPTEPTTGWQLEVTILAGEHKGDVLTIRSEQLRGVEFDLVGMPGTLVVIDGVPSLTIDR